MATIGAGDFVVIRLHDDKSTCLLKVSGEQKIGRTRLSVKKLVGADYESIFQINDKQLEQLTEDSFEDFLAEPVADPNELGDNSSYVDSNTAQKLSNRDIAKLREEGASGAEIIKSLIANSDTFSSKTTFSQEKWIKRKEKKYLRRFRVIKSTPYTVCDVYHAKNKDKVCGMRPDTLAQILSQSGVRSGSSVLVVESVIGLIVGSVAYRLRGLGQILAVYAGQQPHFEIVHALNLDEISTSIIKPIPSNELASAADDVKLQGFSVETETENQQDEQDFQKVTGKSFNSSGRSAIELGISRPLLRKGVESLIIASKYHPLPILREAIVLLRPSCPFVVFSEFMEPLVECYLFLMRLGNCLRLQLSDTWMRCFQVLEGRTHPQMFMPNSGGYLLTGIYVGIPRMAMTEGGLPFEDKNSSSNKTEEI